LAVAAVEGELHATYKLNIYAGRLPAPVVCCCRWYCYDITAVGIVISYCSTGDCWDESEVDWLVSAVRAGLQSGFSMDIESITLFRTNSSRMFVTFRIQPQEPTASEGGDNSCTASSSTVLAPTSNLLAGFRDFNVVGGPLFCDWP
jgi:hypothetical protein